MFSFVSKKKKRTIFGFSKKKSALLFPTVCGQWITAYRITVLQVNTSSHVDITNKDIRDLAKVKNPEGEK